MRAYTDRAPGVRLVTDPPIKRLVDARLAEVPPEQPPVWPPVDEGREDRDLVALDGRVNAGVAVQLLLDRTTGETFVTTVVAGDCLTVAVEPELALDTYRHPGAYGLLPQLG